MKAGSIDASGVLVTTRSVPPFASPATGASVAAQMPPLKDVRATGSSLIGIDSAELLVAASILATVDETRFATHTEPCEMVSASGPSPTGISATTESVSGSMRDTVLSSWLTTRTEPSPNAIAVGSVPTEISTLAPPSGWMRVTLLSPGLLSQTDPAPKATPNGGESSGSVDSRAPAGALI